MQANSGCNVINPATGGMTCPAGFTSYTIAVVNAYSYCTGAIDQQFFKTCMR